MSGPKVQRTVPTSRPYQLWTIADTSWRNRPAGSTVTNDGWGVSYSSLSRIFSSAAMVEGDDGKVELHIYRTEDGGGSFTYHELHKTRYDTQDEAQRAAFEAGALAVMVYVEDFS